jgi:tetrahydromethanopterin S-methyltransferase subunit G
MDKRTVQSAHTRIDNLEKQLIEVKTEVKIQFKEVFTRIKRIESLLIGAAGTIIAMLVAVLMKMG